MKRLIVILVMSAMAVTLFSPTVAALQWDWRKPPPESIIRETRGARPQGDDGGWQGVEKSRESNVHWFFGILTAVDWLMPYLILDNPTSDENEGMVLPETVNDENDRNSSTR